MRDIITRGTPTAVCLSTTHFLAQCSHLKVPTNIQVHVLITIEHGPTTVPAHAIPVNTYMWCMCVPFPCLQTPILRSLMSLFQLLLSHSSWLVVHHSLLAFRQFAEVQYVVLTAPNSSRATNINPLTRHSSFSPLLSPPHMPQWWSSASLPPLVISLWTSSRVSRSSPPPARSWPSESSGCRNLGRGGSVWRDGGRGEWLQEHLRKLETLQIKI